MRIFLNPLSDKKKIANDSGVETIIKRADTALYAAKEAGRNCYKSYAPGE